MSDFIFSSSPQPEGELSRHIQSIYHHDAPVVTEFHGPWGSLAVSRNLHQGFQPYETMDHITVVIGGPVLYFQDNHFLTGDDPVAGTRAIFQLWQNSAMQWDEDLNGPFVILVINKKTCQITCITDLMMFIPVYQFQQGSEVMLGTHVDALARAAGQTGNFDLVSLADFILHWVITYPYTSYKEIRQCHAAATHGFERDEQGGIRSRKPRHYWLPLEHNPYENIDQAAMALRHALQNFIERITASMREVAHFVSAGEDSRSLAGLLPKELKRHAYVFLYGMNREGRLAKAAAEAYGSEFYLATRAKYHYLEILPEATDLVGSGQQFLHVHALGFHRTLQLQRYPAVFGGFLADTLLKAFLKRKIPGYGRLPFLPAFFLPGETRTKPVKHDLFTGEVLDAITRRRRNHFHLVCQIRQKTAHEWFELWPMSMCYGLPNISSNRRLFRSYEPFMSNEVVKISAAVPMGWKLNRRLFNRAMRPFLYPTRWMFHADGRLPYFPWWINCPIQCAILCTLYLIEIIKPGRANREVWYNWEEIVKTQKWKKMYASYAENFINLNLSKKPTQEQRQLLNGKALTMTQKLNLMQVVYSCQKRDDNSPVSD